MLYDRGLRDIVQAVKLVTHRRPVHTLVIQVAIRLAAVHCRKEYQCTSSVLPTA
jgi:hypothetical protein